MSQKRSFIFTHITGFVAVLNVKSNNYTCSQQLQKSEFTPRSCIYQINHHLNNDINAVNCLSLEKLSICGQIKGDQIAVDVGL